jgi:hypothetical protein
LRQNYCTSLLSFYSCNHLQNVKFHVRMTCSLKDKLSYFLHHSLDHVGRSTTLTYSFRVVIFCMISSTTFPRLCVYESFPTCRLLSHKSQASKASPSIFLLAGLAAISTFSVLISFPCSLLWPHFMWLLKCSWIVFSFSALMMMY